MKLQTLLVAFVAMYLLLTACTSQDVKQDEYSGFLGNRYSQLTAAKSPSGEDVMRWISPSFKKADYNKIIVKAPVLFPEGQANDKISTTTLSQITRYLQVAINREVASSATVTDVVAPKTLQLSTAITGVKTSAQGLKPYEVVPVALVAAAVTSSTGVRDQDVALYVEYQLTDAVTGEVLAMGVRKGFGKPLDNTSEHVRFDNLKAAIDVWATDAKLFFVRN